MMVSTLLWNCVVFESSEKQWYVVHCKNQNEEFAKFHLEFKGLQVFFPKLLLPEMGKRGKRTVPLFPSYLFIQINICSHEYYAAIWCPGVRRIVSFGGYPTFIDAKIIELLMKESSPHGVINARSNLKTGQEVQIADGPFAGLRGIIREPPNSKGRVKVLLQLLNRQANVDVPAKCIDACWVPKRLDLETAI